jgi:hypothetical protein
MLYPLSYEGSAAILPVQLEQYFTIADLTTFDIKSEVLGDAQYLET